MIALHRKHYLEQGVLGELTIAGVRFYTLEPSLAAPVHAGHPCIPAGVYRFAVTPSPAFGYTCPELFGVPGRSKIRVHIGNYPKDSLGCILIGSSIPDVKAPFIGGSRKAFALMMGLIAKSGESKIQIIDSATLGDILSPLTHNTPEP